ncbi:MAG: DUF4468 domain-containing protein [Paraprevotella sp.]|nr:DUF4468 domain-containing protein [Paraprevotella sp.]
MKKILVWALLMLPLMGFAKGQDDAKYLVGAVPEENGIVKFEQTFGVKGKTQKEVFDVMSKYVQQIIDANKSSKRTRITMTDSVEGVLAARVEEWMEFKRKPLYLDRTRFRYQLIVDCKDEKCHIEVTQISYYYEEDLDGNNGQLYKAEEWITDKCALNKKKTKLLLGSAKFRRKTVDRAKEIFEKARDAFEVPIPEKQRATQIIED